MKISKKRMHQLITAIPGLFIVLVLFLARQIELAILLLIFDIIGTVGGVWWLHFSKKLAERAHSGLHHKRFYLKPVKLAVVAVILIVTVGTAFLFASLIKTVVATATFDAKCVTSIAPQEWIKYTDCLKNGTSCVNPALTCK